MLHSQQGSINSLMSLTTKMLLLKLKRNTLLLLETSYTCKVLDCVDLML